MGPDAQVTGWLHEVPVDPELALWLFATIPGSSAELATLYRPRSEVEMDIRNVKQTLAMDQLTGKGAAMEE